MENKKDFDYKFEILSDENTQFEDIVSDSSKLGDTDTVSLSSFSGKHHYPKKPHGFFGKIAEWWKRRKTWQKSVMITAASLLLVFAIAFGVLRAVFDYNYNNITNNPDDLGFEGVLNENVINIALFGIDTRNSNSFKGNSDSIMILSLDKDAKKVRIVSIMRDTFVPMDNKGKSGYGKINSAYAKGGPELAIKTINKIFGLDISEYATVNFYGMADIIEAVGGIDAELTSREVAPSDGTLHSINGCIDEICANLGKDSSKYHIFTPGKQHLNGIQAVAYSRIRYVPNIWGTNNDYGRTDRQRHVMEQLFNKAITLDKTQYVKLAKSLIPCSETSLSYGQIMNLATDILLHSPTFEQSRIPQQEFLMPSPSGYGSVVYYDLDFASKIIHAFFYDGINPEDYIKTNGIEKNDWYRENHGYTDKGNTSIPQISGNAKPNTGEVASSEEPTVSSNPLESSVPEENVSSNESEVSSEETPSENNSEVPSESEPSSSSEVESEENTNSEPPANDNTNSGPENTSRKR